MSTLFYHCTIDNRVTGGVTVDGNRIVEAPPVWKNWIGRAWSSFRFYYGRRLKVRNT